MIFTSLVLRSIQSFSIAAALPLMLAGIGCDKRNDSSSSGQPVASAQPQAADPTTVYKERMRNTREALARLEVVLEEYQPLDRAKDVKDGSEKVRAEARIAGDDLTPADKERQSYRTVIAAIGRLNELNAGLDQYWQARLDYERTRTAGPSDAEMRGRYPGDFSGVQKEVDAMKRQTEAFKAINKLKDNVAGQWGLALGSVSLARKQIVEGK